MKEVSKYFLLLSLSGFILSCGSDGSSSFVNTDGAIPQIVDPPTEIVTSTGDADTVIAAPEVFADIVEAEIIEDINAIRLSQGLESLELDPLISAIALEHSLNMADIAEVDAVPLQISHIGFDQRADEIVDLGYVGVAENVAAQRDQPQGTEIAIFVDGWEDSPGHFNNLINDSYTHTGVGVYVDPADGTIYATQLFAAEPE